MRFQQFCFDILVVVWLADTRASLLYPDYYPAQDALAVLHTTTNHGAPSALGVLCPLKSLSKYENCEEYLLWYQVLM